MTQTSPRVCPQCYIPVAAGQRFCPNCGALVPESVSPTAAATPPSYYTPPPPPNSGVPPTQFAGGYTMPAMSPAAPPPPAYDPYSTPGSIPYPVPPPPKKKSSTPFIVIGGIILLVVLLCGGSYLAFSRMFPSGKTVTGNNPGNTTTDGGNNNGNGGGNSGGNNTFAASQQLNLTVVYSSDQMNFTSLQQADKFPDDTLTTFSSFGGSKKNYVRLNFKEQQLSKHSSYFSYRTSFLLILPDKSTVPALKGNEFSGPEQGVSRTNWVDFELSAQIDLTQLTLRLGSQDEAQMDVPLKTGADITKYQPKTATLNKKFTYATLNWTMKDAMQSLFFEGKQAKTGKVFVTIDLVVDNPGSSSVYLFNFARLKSSDGTVSAPDYESDDNNFDVIRAGTTNIQGSETFLVTASNTYTLQLLPGENGDFPAQAVDFQIS